jgi:hypothetical protein
MMLAYVDSAIGRVRAVVAAEADFAKTNPQVGYTCTLSQLPSDQTLVRLRRDGQDNGYAFEIMGCGLAQPHSTYHITARPLHSGLPAFCSDESGILRLDEDGSVEKCIAEGVLLQ